MREINRSFTDSMSCPMLTTCDRGDGDMGILGMKRERSVTEDSLIASSSIKKFDGNSCTKKGSKKRGFFTMPRIELNGNPKNVEEAYPIK